MATLEILHNPRCSKSRMALALLEEKKLSPKVRLYLQDPLSMAELKKLTEKLNLSPAEFIRPTEYKKLELTMATSDSGILKQIAEHPILLERPIVITDTQAKIGRPTEAILDIL